MDNIIPHSKPTLDNIDLKVITKTFNSGMLASGKKLLEFNILFSKYLEKEYIHFFSSGSNALYSLLFALQISKENEVLIPTYICDSVEKSILKNGLTPVFYDNDELSWLSSFEKIQQKITENTKVIILNHTFGIRLSRDIIKKIKSLGIILIEDCAHFISNNKKDIENSKYFDASFYSFNATKLLAVGEGGAIVTNNKNISNEIKKYELDQGISDLSATLGISQLKRYHEFLAKRKEIAHLYFEKLGDITNELKTFSSIYFRFPILVDNDNFFSSQKVSYRKGVDSLLHRKYNFKDDQYMNASEVFNKTVSIPIYPTLTRNEIDIIIEETKRLYYED